jgi:murein DD-endopeptidase MepM/ murein hydrolase activator NlpD
MSTNFDENLPQGVEGAGTPNGKPPKRDNLILRWYEMLTQIGLGELIWRGATHVLSIGLVLAVIWALRGFYRQDVETDQPAPAVAAAPTAAVVAASLPLEARFPGIARTALIHTTIPDRPRQEIIKYTVVKGDTIIGIAEKFGLKPQTILWGNYYILRDDPHNLKIGQELIILPVNGTYYKWNAGDGLNGVAKGFNVTPDVIVNYPANKLDPATLGEYSNPNIAPGTMLIVPGGAREFTSWSAPIGVTRTNPASARVLGAGACGAINGGAVGFGSFIWPSAKHFLSGFDYSPDTNHRGIDIAGTTGEAVWATDAGVIVYAGWNDWGYGSMVMVDHGNGWQSLYAHLNAINVVCGQSVGQGDIIGALGSTGNSTGAHLHFELMHTSYGKVNPKDFLPAP